jgi:hypothetical protein
MTDSEDMLEIVDQEVVISEADECQRKNFDCNVEKYKSTLSSAMREKSMITTILYNSILSALQCGKGGKKAGIDVKFYSWCKFHFKIVLNADIEIICSKKMDTRIAVTENYYQVPSAKSL